MQQETHIDKRKVARAMIQKIKQELAPQEIRTSFIAGYTPPEKIGVKGKEQNYEPDIEVKYNKGTSIYAIELDDDLDINKWRLMSLYARKNNGILHIITPDWLRQSVTEQLENEEINAGLIYFNTNT